ncbi:MAG: signal peptidase I [Candidatus Nanohaloarchaeota archaeon QJJ-5]|nr:signal peptidase I [Candidatus Nanohaloarchaeota archaeon QJJ-5]
MNDFLEEQEKMLFFVLTMVFLAFGLYQTAGIFLNTDVPIVTVVSNSMAPQFERGDIIVVHGTPFEEIEADPDQGDVIVFRSELMNMPIIHRVINRTEDTLETQGDANDGQLKFCRSSTSIYRAPRQGCPSDEETINIEQNITEDQVLGEKIATVPMLGYIKLYPACLYYRLVLPVEDGRLRHC